MDGPDTEHGIKATPASAYTEGVEGSGGFGFSMCIVLMLNWLLLEVDGGEEGHCDEITLCILLRHTLADMLIDRLQHTYRQITFIVSLSGSSRGDVARSPSGEVFSRKVRSEVCLLLPFRTTSTTSLPHDQTFHTQKPSRSQSTRDIFKMAGLSPQV